MPKGMLLWKQHLAPPTPQLGIVMGTSRVGGQSPRVQRAVAVLLINEPFLISCCLVHIQYDSKCLVLTRPMYSTYMYIRAATINYTALVEVSECLCMRVCVSIII